MNLSALKGDTTRKRGKYKFSYILTGFFRDRTYRPIVTFRLCQATGHWKYVGKIVHLFFRVIHRFACNSAGIDMPWETKIGTGFSLVHGWGVVITPKATIGKNVTFFNGVTLGKREKISKDGNRSSEYPVIEDEVWVGPHAVIVGGVVIGKGSRIAAGAFITESIPPYSTVMGNPAAIVKSGGHPDVKNPAP
jgi:serine O-acetyltransferase